MKRLTLATLASLCLAACLMPLPEVATLPQVQLPIAGQENAVWTSTEHAKKPVMIVFMGSWCPYCKMTMPAVMEAAQEFGDKAEIVAVFMDADPAKVQAAVKEHNFTVTSLYNGGELAQAMEVQGLPHTVLFDKKHQAIKHWEGFSPERIEDYRAELKKVTK